METMTVRQVLERTRESLLNIAVPRALNEQIGIPIDGCAENIRLCLAAMARGEQQAAEEEDDGDADAE